MIPRARKTEPSAPAPHEEQTPDLSIVSPATHGGSHIEGGRIEEDEGPPPPRADPPPAHPPGTRWPAPGGREGPPAKADSAYGPDPPPTGAADAVRLSSRLWQTFDVR